MFEKVTNGVFNQVTTIVELHFANEEEKSDERKEKEKRIKRWIDFVTKALNLLIYALLVIVITKLIVVTILHPEQGAADIRKIKEEQHKVSPMQDSIRKQNDTILELKKQIAELKKNTFITDVSNGNESKQDKTNGIPVGTNKKSITLPYKFPEKKSYWEELVSNLPGTLRILLIFVVLLPILWLMKKIMQFFYFINNLISPFSIVKAIGIIGLIIWICKTSAHLFDASSLFVIINKIVPHI